MSSIREKLCNIFFPLRKNWCKPSRDRSGLSQLFPLPDNSNTNYTLYTVPCNVILCLMSSDPYQMTRLKVSTIANCPIQKTWISLFFKSYIDVKRPYSLDVLMVCKTKDQMKSQLVGHWCTQIYMLTLILLVLTHRWTWKDVTSNLSYPEM